MAFKLKRSSKEQMSKINVKQYSEMLYKAISSDKRLKSNLLVLNNYLGTKLNFVKLYVNILDELDFELNKKLQ